MKKNFLQDVIPANHKRSIRDIPLPSHRSQKKTIETQEVKRTARAVKPKPVEVQSPDEHDDFQDKAQVFNPQHFHSANYANNDEHIDEDVHEEPVSRTSYTENKRPRKKSPVKKIFVGVLIGAIIAVGAIASRTQAKVTIYPKQATHEIDLIIPTEASSTLAVKTQITKNASITLQATSEQQVEQQATGRIKIINNHAQTSQDLVKNTRFQTPEGLVYRIRESVSVPGYTSAGPGALEVEVYADSAGEEYNIGKTKFTIPGFSGMDQFTKITAESVTDMTGGYIGIKKVVSEDEKEQAEDDLVAKLQAQFTDLPEISESYVVVTVKDSVTYGEIKDVVEGSNITLSMTASADAYSFKKQDFLNFVGQNSVPGASNTNSFTFDPSNLTYLAEKDAIKVNGTSSITWLTDLEALKKAIAGKKRSEIADVVNSYDSFEKTDVLLKPFWKTKFPADTNKITIETAS